MFILSRYSIWLRYLAKTEEICYLSIFDSEENSILAACSTVTWIWEVVYIVLGLVQICCFWLYVFSRYLQFVFWAFLIKKRLNLLSSIMVFMVRAAMSRRQVVVVMVLVGATQWASSSPSNEVTMEVSAALSESLIHCVHLSNTLLGTLSMWCSTKQIGQWSVFIEV